CVVPPKTVYSTSAHPVVGTGFIPHDRVGMAAVDSVKLHARLEVAEAQVEFGKQLTCPPDDGERRTPCRREGELKPPFLVPLLWLIDRDAAGVPLRAPVLHAPLIPSGVVPVLWSGPCRRGVFVPTLCGLVQQAELLRVGDEAVEVESTVITLCM